MPGLTESWIATCASRLIQETLPGKEAVTVYVQVLPTSSESVLGTSSWKAAIVRARAPFHTNIAQGCAVAPVVAITISQGQALPLEAGTHTDTDTDTDSETHIDTHAKLTGTHKHTHTRARELTDTHTHTHQPTHKLPDTHKRMRAHTHKHTASLCFAARYS